MFERKFYRCATIAYSISSIVKNSKWEKYAYNYINNNKMITSLHLI